MPSDTIYVYDFNSGEHLELTIQEVIYLRNKHATYVYDLTVKININQRPIANKLRGNSNSSLQ